MTLAGQVCNNRVEIQTGAIYGRLTILEEAPGIYEKGRGVKRYVFCGCTCGNVGVFSLSSLRRKTKSRRSCGCMIKEQIVELGKKQRKYTNSVLNTIWHAMFRRCHIKTDPSYDNYGGRGIKVCDEWMSQPQGVQKFIDWCESNGYKKGKDLDRRNNDKGYSPSNCRFVTRRVNNNNKRTNVVITYKSKKYNLESFWSKFKDNDVSLNTFRYRLYNNEKPISAVRRPLNLRKDKFNGARH